MNHKERVRITHEIDRLERLQKQSPTRENNAMIKALEWVMELKV